MPAYQLNFNPKSGGSGKNPVTVSTSEYTGNTEITRTIRFQCGDSYKDVKIIKQAAEPMLSLESQDSVIIPRTQQRVQFNFRTNCKKMMFNLRTGGQRIEYRVVIVTLDSAETVDGFVAYSGTSTEIDFKDFNATYDREYMIAILIPPNSFGVQLVHRFLMIADNDKRISFRVIQQA